jgi:hypothetical protein
MAAQLQGWIVQDQKSGKVIPNPVVGQKVTHMALVDPNKKMPRIYDSEHGAKVAARLYRSGHHDSLTQQYNIVQNRQTMQLEPVPVIIRIESKSLLQIGLG